MLKNNTLKQILYKKNKRNPADIYKLWVMKKKL